MSELQFHEHASLFPLMEGEEYDTFVADIHENGLQEPIVLYEGEILDGRNRYRACKDIGLEPQFRNYSGDNPLGFVISHNLHRRHLNETQRAMIAGRLPQTYQGKRTDIKEEKQPRRNSSEVKTWSKEEAGAALNVSRDSVRDARFVLKEGTDEEIEKLDKGEAAVSTLAKRIKSGVKPEERLQRETQETKVKRQETKAMRGNLWGKFRDAIDSINSMPKASDMVDLVKQYDRSGERVEKLDVVIKWLEEFRDECNKDK